MSIITFNDLSAYISEPKESSKRAIVLLSEWWGLNSQIKRLADRFASQGFVVVVPDLFHGKVPKDANEANHLMTGLDFKGAVRECGQWADYLKNEKLAKSVGVTGFCMGGALTIACASKHSADGRFNAASVFYGIPDLSYFPVKSIECPLLLNFGRRDDMAGFSDEATVNKLVEELKRNETIFQLDWYEAGHAFMNEDRPEVYREASAREAFNETIGFFNRYLK